MCFTIVFFWIFFNHFINVKLLACQPHKNSGSLDKADDLLVGGLSWQTPWEAATNPASAMPTLPLQESSKYAESMGHFKTTFYVAKPQTSISTLDTSSDSSFLSLFAIDRYPMYFRPKTKVKE